MYCPNCGTESAQGQRYCRACGTNLTIVSKAVTLGEAIARSDRGPLPKIKAAIENIKLDQASAEIARGFEQITREIESGISSRRSGRRREPPSPAERREKYLVEGFKTLLGGIALMIFLYVLSGVLELRIPPEKAARFPFVLEPVIRIAWLLGLIPALTGLGQILASLFIRVPRPTNREFAPGPPNALSEPSPQITPPSSVTEYTTELLETSDPNAPARNRARQGE